MTEFEEGMKYERLRSRVYQRLFLGYGCLVCIPLFALAQLTNKVKLISISFSLIFGIFSLIIGYSDKKQLKEYEQQIKEGEG